MRNWKEMSASCCTCTCRNSLTAVLSIMPPKQAIDLNISDSSTYPGILPLWSRDRISMTVPYNGMADTDPQDPALSGHYNPWYARMERALRVATRAVISSSPFFLRVLCSNVIVFPHGSIFDPDYTPTDENHREYRAMLENLSENHRLYVNGHKRHNKLACAQSMTSSNSRAYVFWTILNPWFLQFYSRSDFDNVPESQRRTVDFFLAVTLAHEYSHLVYRWRQWKELLSEERPYQHCSPRFLAYSETVHAHYEPRLHVRQRTPEIGNAWEDFTFDGFPRFKDYDESSAYFSPFPSQGLEWAQRGATCCTAQVESSLVLGEEFHQDPSTVQPTTIPEDQIDRFVSMGCWDYVEDLLRLDRIVHQGQVALVKDVQLLHVLRFPRLYDWLLFVPRHHAAPVASLTVLAEELKHIVDAEKHAGDTIAPTSTATSNTSAPTSMNRRPRTSAIMDGNAEQEIGSVLRKASGGKVSKTKGKSSRSTGPRAKPKSASK